MFGLGWTEMLVIGVVALIVIGPKDLPVMMNRMGKAVSTIRRMGSEFQREINKASGLDQITDLRKSITEPLKQTANDLRKEFNKPLPNGGVAPSGAIKPKDPNAESVVAEIHEKVGMTPPTTTAAVAAPAAAAAVAAPPSVSAPEPVASAAAPAEPAAVDSPAPIEAIPPKKPRAPRKPRVTPAAEAAPVVDLLDGVPPMKVAKPRKPRAPKPKPDVTDV
jgi:sec-independent protein translocase protein TatB